MDIIGQNGNDGLHYDEEPNEPLDENNPQGKKISNNQQLRGGIRTTMIGYLIKTLTDMKQENTMSKKYEYKYKLFAKIHQLQKRLYRTAL